MNNFSRTQLVMLFVAILAVLVIVGVLVIGESSDSQPATDPTSTTTPQQEESVSDSNTPTSSDATSSATDTPTTTDTASLPTQSEVLTASVDAVARVTAPEMSPQAGVLLNIRGQNKMIVPASNPSNSAEGLFEDGVVVSLSLDPNQSDDEFSVYRVGQASGSLSPLTAREYQSETGEEMYVVPLSGQPQIFQTTVSAVSESGVQIESNNLPAGSLLLNTQAEVVGLFSTNGGIFPPISSLMAN